MRQLHRKALRRTRPSFWLSSKAWPGRAWARTCNHMAAMSGIRKASVVIPWPPSVNRYWRSVNGRNILSAEARAYRITLEAQALAERWPKFGGQRIAVQIDAWPPDRRRRDLDNVLKATLDAGTHTGLWDDDSQIDSLTIVRRSPTTGVCSITVEVI